MIPACPKTVVPGRLELPTSTLSVWRSNQLSYRTVRQLMTQLLPFSIFSNRQTAQYKKKQYN